MAVTYERPVEATLVVRLVDGNEWTATAEDLVKFGYVSKLDAYMAFDNHLRELLLGAGLIERDTTEARVNPLRYLVELAINYPDLLAHPEVAENDAAVVAIERALQALLANAAAEEAN